MQLEVVSITPCEEAGGLCAKITANQDDIPLGTYHQDGICGSEMWRVSIQNVLFVKGIPPRIEFRGRNTIIVTWQGIKATFDDFVSAVMEDNRFLMVGEEHTLPDVSQPVLA